MIRQTMPMLSQTVESLFAHQTAKPLFCVTFGNFSCTFSLCRQACAGWAGAGSSKLPRRPRNASPPRARDADCARTREQRGSKRCLARSDSRRPCSGPTRIRASQPGSTHPQLRPITHRVAGGDGWPRRVIVSCVCLFRPSTAARRRSSPVGRTDRGAPGPGGRSGLGGCCFRGGGG